ncbi:MAG: transposase [Deltaproteobacteria bacterium]|nr:transposase [Deltaproteobacteria bacterium]
MDIAEVYKQFPTDKDCIAHLEHLRWKGKPQCPYCQSDRLTPMAAEMRHHCNSCKTSFSVTVGTIFHRSHLPLQKWFLAIALILNGKEKLSNRQLGGVLQVTKDTARSMHMRVRNAAIEQSELFNGIVRNMYRTSIIDQGAGL